MLLENSFEVPADIDRVWSYLLEVDRVVVCMPGAELTETIDERNWKGRVNVKLGPVSLSFAGKVTMAERDDEAHRVVLEGSGMEQRGKGRAAATVTTTAEQTPNGTRVTVVQDLQVQGQVASMSRGMMGDVTAKLTKQFAECLEANLRAEQEPRAAASEGVAGAPAASQGVAGAPGAATAPAEGARAAAPTPGAPETRSAPEPQRAPAARAREVRGFSLLLGALAGAVRRLFLKLRDRVRERRSSARR